MSSNTNLTNANSNNNKKKGKLLFFVIILFFLLCASCSLSKKVPAPESESSNSQPNLLYKIANNDASELVGIVEGREYKIDLSLDGASCIRIIEQSDFDDDGLLDALIEENACGGNGALDSYFFVSYKGNGFFQRTKNFGYTWNDPLIEKWNDKTSVVVESINFGVNNDDSSHKIERYILKDGQALLVESMKKQKLIVLKEIRASEFSSDNPDEVKYLNFDLDGDNKEDEITCTFWERWGSILVSKIKFSSGITTDDISTGCKRIGVLETKTNNIHDLVCDEDDILRWNGKKYE